MNFPLGFEFRIPLSIPTIEKCSEVVGNPRVVSGNLIIFRNLIIFGHLRKSTDGYRQPFGIFVFRVIFIRHFCRVILFLSVLQVVEHY